MNFFVRKATNEQFYFVIRSDNNEVVATSETYIYKSSCLRTIESIKAGINKSSSVIDMTE